MKRTTSILCLLLAAIIWGHAFVAQSIGAQSLGPNSFLASRSWLGALSILPLAMIQFNRDNWLTSLKAGALCGLFLFLASLTQQIGIADTTTAKSGFITSLYMLIVPIISYFLKKPLPKRLWPACCLSLIGLALLCLKLGQPIQMGDWWTLSSAFLFALQILVIERFVQGCSVIWMNLAQFVSCALLASFFACFEPASLSQWNHALPAILYAGIASTGIAYTLQLVGQKNLPATIAGLIMCLEAVFSALAGWVFLGQALTGFQLLGCCLIFSASALVTLGQKDIE